MKYKLVKNNFFFCNMLKQLKKIYLTVQFIKDKFQSTDNFFNGARNHNDSISRPREKLLVTWELDPRPGLSLKLSDGRASFPYDGTSRRIGYKKPYVCWLLSIVWKKKRKPLEKDKR